MPWWQWWNFKGAPLNSFPPRIARYGERASIAPEVATCVACRKTPTQVAFGSTPLCAACAIMAENEGRKIPVDEPPT